MFERYSDRARKVIVTALWSARKRRGSHLEVEDLLHAVIREDRGEFSALAGEMFPGDPGEPGDPPGGRIPFFTGQIAAVLLRELQEDPAPWSAGGRAGKLEAAPAFDMPTSRSLQQVLERAAKNRPDDTKAIEPLHLLAAIAEDRESRLAQLLRDHGITRQKIARALDPGSAERIEPDAGMP